MTAGFFVGCDQPLMTTSNHREPLCAFLGKPAPDEPFPDSNKGANFDARVMKLYEGRFKRAFRNVAVILVGILAAIVALVMSWWT